MSADILASHSRRTARPNRRRRSSISTATSRSSASSSSSDRSALRVTRKGRCSSICIPRNSASSLAAMISSSSTQPEPSASATNRGSVSGTLTRANRRSPVSGSRTVTARFSDRLEM